MVELCLACPRVWKRVISFKGLVTFVLVLTSELLFAIFVELKPKLLYTLSYSFVSVDSKKDEPGRRIAIT